MLRDVVLVHVDVISVGIEVVVEHERGVHETARVHKASPFAKFHLLDIEDKASVENVERCGALASEKKNLVVGDLMGEAHVRWNPTRLVDLGSANLLPDVARDVIDFDRVDDALLVDTPAKRKNVVIFEDAEGSA